MHPSVLPTLDEPWLALRGPFRLSEPALDEFPAALWSRLAARQVRRMPAQHMVYGDPMGLRALREALAAHLRTFRSVACTADQIMIVSVSQQALALTWRALLEPGEAAWLEEPGYHGARDALLLAGVKIVPVPVGAGFLVRQPELGDELGRRLCSRRSGNRLQRRQTTRRPLMDSWGERAGA